MNRTAVGRREAATPGASARAEDFADFVAAHQEPLLRAAYLLTGDRDAARELATVSLGRLHLSWAHASAGDGAEAFLRRDMFRAHTSPWRRLRRVRHAQPQVEGSNLWRAIRSLPPRQRALVVLCHYEGLTETEAADVLGISAVRARSLLTSARDALKIPSNA